MKILKFVIISVAAVVFGFNYLHANPSKPNVVVVRIVESKFLPEVVTIKPGITVQWVNEDNVVHDVTSGISVTGKEAMGVEKPKNPDGKFYSGIFSTRKKFKLKLTEKGEYPYYCNLHPFMTGKIVVD